MGEEPAAIKNPVIEHLEGRLAVLVLLGGTVLIDGIFFVVVGVVNWVVDSKILEPMKLQGFNAWLLLSCQIAFGIATFATVVIFAIEDIITIAMQASDRIRQKAKK